MTPSQIIDQGKKRFDVLYISDNGTLEALVEDALGAFEDRGGAVRSILIESPFTTVAKPSDYLAVVGSCDANGFYIECIPTDTDITIPAISPDPAYPISIKYLVKFRGMPMDGLLPDESVGLILKHFVANLSIRNTRRERAMATAAGIQVELPSEDALTARLDAVEIAMEEDALIIPMITVM